MASTVVGASLLQLAQPHALEQLLLLTALTLQLLL